MGDAMLNLSGGLEDTKLEERFNVEINMPKLLLRHPSCVDSCFLTTGNADGHIGASRHACRGARLCGDTQRRETLRCGLQWRADPCLWFAICG